MMRIRKDDVVQVISGREKGKSGRVLQVFPKTGMCLVERINLVKRHQKARPQGGPSGIVEKPAKIMQCKLMHIDSKTNKPSRIRYVTEGKTKVRKLVKSGEVLAMAGAK